MKIINAPVRANGNLAHCLIREMPGSSWVKRQTRRQDRRLLRKDLQRNMDVHLDAEMHVTKKNLSSVRKTATLDQQTATILPFPLRAQVAHRSVTTGRKKQQLSFRHQVVDFESLAA